MAIEVKATAFSYVTHVLGIAAAVLVLVWTIHFRGGLAWEDSNKSLIFNLHPVLILIGLIIIGGEAIISYKSLPLKKQEKKLIHLVLHGIALILGIIGVYLAFKFHNESNIANLYSLHSWLGIGIISLYGLQAYKWGLFMLPGFHYLFSAWLLIVVGVLLATTLTSDSPQEYLWIYGFVVFFYPGGTALIRKESLPWHVLFGLFVYVLAVGNATLGFLEKLTFLENSGLAKYGSEAFLVNFTAIVTVLFGTFVLLTVLSQAPAEDNFRYEAI